jgi:hypothetical protein
VSRPLIRACGQGPGRTPGPGEWVAPLDRRPAGIWRPNHARGAGSTPLLIGGHRRVRAPPDPPPPPAEPAPAPRAGGEPPEPGSRHRPTPSNTRPTAPPSRTAARRTPGADRSPRTPGRLPAKRSTSGQRRTGRQRVRLSIQRASGTAPRAHDALPTTRHLRQGAPTARGMRSWLVSRAPHHASAQPSATSSSTARAPSRCICSSTGQRTHSARAMLGYPPRPDWPSPGTWGHTHRADPPPTLTALGVARGSRRRDAVRPQVVRPTTT